MTRGLTERERRAVAVAMFEKAHEPQVAQLTAARPMKWTEIGEQFQAYWNGLSDAAIAALTKLGWSGPSA